MKIQAAETFGTRRLNIEEIASQCAEKVPLFTEAKIEIDFSRCVLDYPATSLISDAIFRQIDGAPKPRQISFIFDIDFPERVFLKSFFFGSARLKLEGEKATEEEIKENLRLTLIEINASLTISIFDPDSDLNSPVRAFTYGQ